MRMHYKKLNDSACDAFLAQQRVMKGNFQDEQTQQKIDRKEYESKCKEDSNTRDKNDVDYVNSTHLTQSIQFKSTYTK